MGDPNPIEFVKKETLRIPFKSGVVPPNQWPNTFKSWPFPPITGWRNWYRRMLEKSSSNWETQDIHHCLELSLSEMPRNDFLLIAASHFWSDAVNAFLFGHGPMSITLADVFMMTGLNVTEPVYPWKYKFNSNQKAVKTGCGWAKYIQTYMSTGAVSDKEYKAFMNMWLCRFIFCGKSNEPTLNHIIMAEELASGDLIPLGKYLLGATYHMMHQITAQMRQGGEISCVNGPWWLVQMWLQLYMHRIVSVDLHSLSFPSINYAEGSDAQEKACQTYGEAASSIIIELDIGHLFKLFFKGFGKVLWLPYRENEDLTLPCKFSYESCSLDQTSVGIFNSIIKPCTLPAEFHHGRQLHPTYEFYNPNMVARQLGCSQLPPRLFFSNLIRPRETIGDAIEAKKVFELGWDLPTYEPSPLELTDTAHPLFVSWWQEWHAHIFNIPVHPLCQDLQPQFAPDSEDIEPPLPSQEVQYYQAGPIPALGFNAPTLAAFMKIPALLGSAPLKEYKRKAPGGPSQDIIITKKPRSKKAKSPLKLQASPPRSVNILTLVEPPPQTSVASSETQGAAGLIDDILDEIARESSSHQVSSPPPLVIEQNPQASQDKAQLNEDPIQQGATKPTVSYSFSLEEYIGEKGEEATSQQKLSTENQALLKEIALLLNKDINVLTQDANQIRDLIGLIDQEIPSTLKASLESVAHFDDYFGVVRRASENIASRAILKNNDLVRKQQAKELHSQIQADKHSLATLKPELEAMEEEKIRLEAQLAELNSKIQSHKEKIANLPNSIDAAKAKITSIIKESQQIKTKLTKIPGAEEDDQKVLGDISRIKIDAMDAINSFLNE